MISSFLFSMLLLVLRKFGIFIPTHYALILTVVATTVGLDADGLLRPQDRHGRRLVRFYSKVRPFGPGWEPVRKAAGIGRDEARSTGDNFPVALVGWVSGSATIWSGLFTVGNVLYKRWTYAGILLGVFVVSGLVLIRVINRLWAKEPVAAGPGAATT